MFRRLVIRFLIGDGKLPTHIRHLLSFIAGIAVSRGMLSVDSAATLTEALYQMLTTPEILGGIATYALGQGAATANKDLH